MMDICMDDTVPFKVFVVQPGSNKPEVRRFGIDKGAVASFQYLNAKICSVFPSVRDKTFTVCWKDSDGDEIIISSDDELLIALANMNDDLKKLHVTVEGQPDKHVTFECFTPRHSPPKRPAMSRDIGSECHEGVVCDSCNGPVCGFRYKCVSCSNYDLCSSCESQQQHGHHFMLRIPFNYGSASHMVSRTLGYKLLKSLQKGGFCEMDNFKSDDEDFGCRYSRKLHKKMAKENHHWERKHHKDHKHQRPHSNLFKTVTDYMSDFVNLIGDVDPTVAPNAGGDAPQTAQNQSTATAGTSASAGTSAAGNAANAEANAESGQRTKRRRDRDGMKKFENAFHEEYLRDIGKTVAKILDPFGIDVDIEVRSKKNKSTEENSQEGVASTSKNIPSTSTAGVEENKQTQESVTQNAGNEQNSARAAGDSSPSPDRADGWTLINDDPSDSELQSADATQPLLPTSILATELDKFAKVFQKHLKLQSETKADEANAPENATKIYPNIAGLVETPYTVHEPFSNQVGSPAQKPTPRSTEPTTPIDITSQSSASGNASPKQATPPLQSSGNETAKEVKPQPQPQRAEQTRRPQEPQRAAQPPRHLAPHIAAALDQMMSMGFSNDGGWLTQLLESRNGNISAVVDLLTPVSKKN